MAKRSNPAVEVAQETAHNAMFDADGKPKPGVHNVLLRAVEVQRPLVLANIRRLQTQAPSGHRGAARGHPGAGLPAGRHRRRGAGGRQRPSCPASGPSPHWAFRPRRPSGFLEATALFSTSLAELHGIRLVDPEKASTLVMAIMLGEEGTALLSTLSGQAAGRGRGPTQAWGTRLRPGRAARRLRRGAGQDPDDVPREPAEEPGHGAGWAGPCRSASAPSWAESVT